MLGVWFWFTRGISSFSGRVFPVMVVLVAGFPAKVVRDLKPEEIEYIKQSAQNYIAYKIAT